MLDLDPAHGTDPPPEWATARDGREVLALVAERAGQPFPGNTYSTRTPSGGLHLYFQAPPLIQLRNTVARLGWRVDSRGTGGYVVAAGSVLSNGRYDLITDRPVAPLPAWLVPLLLSPIVHHTADAQYGTGRKKPANAMRRNAYLQAIHDSVAAAVPGTRHHVLIRASYSLGRLAAGGDLEMDDARACLRTAVGRWSGRPSRKDTRTIEDGLRAGALRPRRLAG